MEILITVLLALLRAFLPAAVQAATPRSEDGAQAPELRERLKTKIETAWPKG